MKLIALVIAAVFALDAYAEDQEPNLRSASIWVQPLGIAASLAVPKGDRAFYLPLGMNIELWSIEVSYFQANRAPIYDYFAPVRLGPNVRRKFFSVVTGVGRAFHLGNQTTSPWILVPKSGLSLMKQDFSNLTFARDDGLGVEVTVGLDIGAQWRWGPVYFAAITGLSVGMCLNCQRARDTNGGYLREIFGDVDLELPYSGPIANFNLNLVRIGFAF